jgi:hypothetical protein
MYQEMEEHEVKTTAFRAVCVGCDRRGPSGLSRAAARRLAEKEGWAKGARGWACPECVVQGVGTTQQLEGGAK